MQNCDIAHRRRPRSCRLIRTIGTGSMEVDTGASFLVPTAQPNTSQRQILNAGSSNRLSAPPPKPQPATETSPASSGVPAAVAATAQEHGGSAPTVGETGQYVRVPQGHVLVQVAPGLYEVQPASSAAAAPAAAAAPPQSEPPALPPVTTAMPPLPQQQLQQPEPMGSQPLQLQGPMQVLPQQDSLITMQQQLMQQQQQEQLQFLQQQQLLLMQPEYQQQAQADLQDPLYLAQAQLQFGGYGAMNVSPFSTATIPSDALPPRSLAPVITTLQQQTQPAAAVKSPTGAHKAQAGSTHKRASSQRFRWVAVR